jgi:putative oxidoreductase
MNTASAIGRAVARWVASLYAALDRVPLSLMQLLMRLGIGSVFLSAGLLKYRSWELTLLLFRDEYKVPLADPALMARVATFNELVFSALLIVGLGTRLATLPFFGMIATIQLFVYPNAWVEHLVWTSILLVLVTRGGGQVSLDHLISVAIGTAPLAPVSVRSRP